MNFVAVDLGASNTRFTDDTGRIGFLPNNMLMFDDIRKVIKVEPTDDDLQNALEIIIEKEGESQYFPVKALAGNIAERASTVQVQPSAMSHKHTQRINYVSTIMATAVSKMINNLSDDLTLFIALPPIEVKTFGEVVKNNLVGRYKVTFPKYLGGRVVTFNVADVVCKEESVMAVFSYFFDMNGVIREEHRQYLSGNVLSLDIGASTTDLAIIKNGQYQDKTGRTFKTGGNIARDVLVNRVREEYGYDLPNEEADLAMAEGRLQQGNGYIDIPEIVDEAKQALADSIVVQMDSYFRSVNTPIQTIKAIIVSGGGSLQSKYVDKSTMETKIVSKPISEYITDKMKQYCETISIESYGENSRVANVSGLFVTAKMTMIKRSQTFQG